MPAESFRLFKDESGATMVEYGIMVALIAVVATVAVRGFGVAIRDQLFQIAVGLFP